MGDLIPQTEIRDVLGTTVPFVGTVGTTAVNVPSSPGNRITHFFIHAPNQTLNTKRLYYSIDSGTTFLELWPGESIIFPMRGNVTQLQLKGNVSGVSYEVILNLDQTGE